MLTGGDKARSPDSKYLTGGFSKQDPRVALWGLGTSFKTQGVSKWEKTLGEKERLQSIKEVK